MAEVYPTSGVRVPEDAEEPVEGLESAGLRLEGTPYRETERRREGNRGRRDRTAEGSMENNIEVSLWFGRNSADTGRILGAGTGSRSRNCDISNIKSFSWSVNSNGTGGEECWSS